MIPYFLDGQTWAPISQLRSQNPPEALTVRMHVEGQKLTVALQRNDGLFASRYTETHHSKDGTDVSLPGNGTGRCYYHGSVRGSPGSSVSLAACSGLRGFIQHGNKSFVFEPLGRGGSGHKITPMARLGSRPGACGHGLARPDPLQLFPAPARRPKRETQKMAKYVELVMVADNREFQRQGKDVEKVKQRLIEMANHVDKLYRPLNVRIVLVGVEVWSSLDRCIISQDPFLSLHEFLDWRKLKLLPRRQHDNAQLVSGVFFQGTTVGMAPLLSMCTVEQSGGIVMDHSDHPVGTAVTLAHELGHNFGMNHDTPDRGCSCPSAGEKGGCIMNPSTGYPLPGAFSSCSERDLEESLQKGVGTCLFNPPDAKESLGARRCGNGFVEEGEECDCGEPEECTSRCCNATSCTLKPGAVCAHGLCCEDCQLKPAGVCCRASSNPCDLPEFCTGAGPHCPGNVYLHDGLPCARVDGYCYSGLCRTHQDQCAALWGPGAKAAPGICFEKVNAAGDPYGNCGKQSRTSFAKCEARDAKCGKIQCQGGASRPVIGTNAVSIETNIALQDGGRIRCRGTHVYLGDDVPDPGLVVAGTKCGEGKICLNRQCQNVSVFGVSSCLARCHGHGVCNSNQNCHCEAEWAPPFCDVPGFGGSVDSGPVRRADGRGRTLGLLGTLLGLAAVGSALWLQRKSVMRLLMARERLAGRKIRLGVPTQPPALPPNCLDAPRDHPQLHRQTSVQRLLPTAIIQQSAATKGRHRGISAAASALPCGGPGPAPRPTTGYSTSTGASEHPPKATGPGNPEAQPSPEASASRPPHQSFPDFWDNAGKTGYWTSHRTREVHPRTPPAREPAGPRDALPVTGRDRSPPVAVKTEVGPLPTPPWVPRAGLRPRTALYVALAAAPGYQAGPTGVWPLAQRPVKRLIYLNTCSGAMSGRKIPVKPGVFAAPVSVKPAPSALGMPGRDARPHPVPRPAAERVGFSGLGVVFARCPLGSPAPRCPSARGETYWRRQEPGISRRSAP
ncbi:disintegrin and metalloproteinase domain-containing protein 12 [Tachyglossus aculeatus]|uniref:disintegrin and metalloproteinase domain-containing protein 12 n=1 Tax=Tachyglossus aculeatus TaxID=9261 RepID=UPI0018F29E63|nr:disintegrin and metalloproteinase domain-containing protein 12 [Tachyglossus aculeatus]